MKMRLFIILGMLAGLSACKEPDSVVVVNVAINADVQPIYSLQVAMSTAQAHDTKTYPASASKTQMAATASFAVVVSRSRFGELDLALDGLDSAGQPSAHGTAQTKIVVGGTATVSVTLVAGASTCGNGIIDSSEACDDNNQFSFDGCDFRCQWEGLLPDAGIPDSSAPDKENPDTWVEGPVDTTRAETAADSVVPRDLAGDPGIPQPDQADASLGSDGGQEGASDTQLTWDAPSPQPDTPPTQPDASAGGPLGQTCTAKEQCASGNCVDGVCCQSPCASVCMACNLPTSPGQCTMVPVGQNPRGECTQDLASTCGRDGTCDGNGGCRLWPDGTECATATCSAGTASTARTCDGAGTCRAASSKACAPYACKGTACTTQCNGNSDCDAGSYISAASYCSVGTCLRRQSSGSCTSAIQCVAGQYCNLGLQTCAGAVCTCPATCPYSCISNDGYACSCP